MIIDLSSNNPHPINYGLAKNAGVTGVFVKATDGAGYTNPYYAQDVAGFRAVGVPVLAYHFAEFGDPRAEAAHFVAVAGPLARVLDVETAADVAWINAFLGYLNLPASEELTYGSASTLPRSGIRSLLWPASYGKDYGFGDCWQYTDAQSVPGIAAPVDASTWRGPQEDFDALFSIAPTPTPKPQEDTVRGVSPFVVSPDGTRHRFYIFMGALGHSWAPPGKGWSPENVEQIAGHPEITFDENQVPVPQVSGNAITVGAVDTSGRPWEAAQFDEHGWSLAPVMPS